ncbi:efflux transporter, outer membrane factor lipoprotein, NodT family [Bernardetia litoralis DSM 6794]|uniref:Efflux transporter, outer membrane factor lipoprotein, NodT family n=1 Tax=Bernardetia litoralis (strain ATCC 23117 / DSM 6794 / NBRC 15988 / NCIMB 1366 / Fx l1 / Sio-4) TaxID=880071 RepID=I4APA9_BERLS|nr:efflux transporter outer membrane subunit [Bernardetia litoralis]AFM05794.1 efflux transporter, outer membrane factor lipoprotein, NodT family [Bernardetia litoralis DSM 6794]
MKNRIVKYIIPFAFILPMLNSCGVVNKNYLTPDVGFSNTYRNTEVLDTTSIAMLHWEEIITDSTLQGLIKEGLQNNLNLKVALENINQAEASLMQAKLSFLPSLYGNIQEGQSKTSQAALNFGNIDGINLTTNSYLGQLSSSWEADIWGKLRSNKRSVLASFLKTEAAARAIQTQLISDIAVSYYNLLALDAQLEITQKTLQNRIRDQETMKFLKESAIVDGAAVVQSEASRYEIEASIPDIELRIQQEENALSILLGRMPVAIERSSLAEQTAYSDLSIGLPASFLRNRPDVQEAELAFRAAFEDVNVAKTYFYPSFTITANGGLSSLSLTDFFNNSIFYNLIGGLTQPIFANGENKARLKINESLQHQAFYDYKATWLNAGGEVSNALFLYQKAKEKQESRAYQIVALEKSVEFTEALLEYSSTTNYIDVLTSKNNLLSAQLNSISDKQQKLQAVVQLYRALGGGWMN